MTYKYVDKPTEDFQVGTYRYDEDDGIWRPMSNFTAEIIEDVIYIDGREKRAVYTVRGSLGDEELPEVEVEATAFAGLAWIADKWGAGPVIFPGNANKDNLRTAIQIRTRPTKRNVYLATGWQTIRRQDEDEMRDEEVFLHVGGAITANHGNDTTIKVQLPEDLRRYDMTTTEDHREGMKALLELPYLTMTGDADEIENPEIGWVLLAATLSPVFGPVDFAAHLTGRSGTYKSELCGLFQSCFGPMDARTLPASWSSTANANESLAYRARNVSMTIDDFVPTGTSQDKTKLNKAADQLFRGAGNQAGKARLTDRSNLQQTMYPRGILISTGEDTPEGHSVRGRTAIMEISPGTISPKSLTACQSNRRKYVAATVGLIMWLAKHPERRKQVEEAKIVIRDKHLEIGHSRTPAMLGHLIAVSRMVLEYCRVTNILTQAEAKRMKAEAENAILTMGSKQKQYLEQTDPAQVAMESIRKLLTSGGGHFRTTSGGVPKFPEQLGWQKTSEGDGSAMPTYTAKGKKLGWVDWPAGEMFLDIGAAYADMKRVSDGKLQLTQQTAIKRIGEAGFLARREGARNRNTVRVVAEQHTQTVIVLRLAQVLQTEETPE